jgi:subtilisin-like proprotein convertase family protein
LNDNHCHGLRLILFQFSSFYLFLNMFILTSLGICLRKFALLPVLLLLSLSVYAQLWSDIRETAIITSGERRIIPEKYHTLTLNFDAMRQLLSTAPDESDVINGFSQGINLAIPFPDGRMLRFRVWESSVMHPDLQAQFPQIRSYAGHGIDQPQMRIRFDQTHMGFHAMVLGTGQGAVFIDPYAYGDVKHYISYFKQDFIKRDGSVFTCHVEDNFAPEIEVPGVNDAQRAAGCGTIRVYDLALAGTGEYSNFHGSNTTNNDKSFALAAMNTSMTRVNGVFENEISVRMVIVANNTNIIYLNPATDPYTNGTPNVMINENQTNCDAVIGFSNYDIGHVFGTNSGGLAQLNSPCSSGKARGVTGSGAPVGDPFDIDYVAHEMGHQFGAYHTQYNDCNRTWHSAMEPGSASTIMGYAGICSPNVQSNSDAYFHTKSLRQMGAFVVGSGSSCPTSTPNGNSQPSLAALSSYTIPISTAFVLTGVGSDPNGDAITYCWEQVDSMPNSSSSMQTQPPASTNTEGPMFRSLDPSSNPFRYFPSLAELVNNPAGGTWEVLPSVPRTMNFRCTVRDNRANGGCSTERNMSVTTTGSTPFTVTSPNTAVTWAGNSIQTVTWNVAGTTAAPISCANVDILISTDGGLTYTTLLANTPNDGSADITTPNTTSSSARIMVKCSSSIFFDISNEDFSLGVYCNQVFSSTDVPKTIPAAGTVTSVMNIPATENILDVNLVDLIGTHTWMGDLTFKIKSPAGTERTLFGGICNSSDNFNLNFDDESGLISIPCPPTSGLTYRPSQSFSPFDGQNMNGTWTLTIIDAEAPDSGTLTSWGLSFCTSSPILPVELFSFEAQPVANTVKLKWETATESNNKGFHVERSVNQANTFKSIGWVDGKGNSLEKQQYEFTDSDIDPATVYYYRIRQMDENGDATQSPVEVVVTEGKKDALAIFPNPGSDFVRLLLPASAAEQTLRVQCWSVNGQLMFEQNTFSGQELDLRELPEGIYNLHITGERQTWSKSVIKR